MSSRPRRTTRSSRWDADGGSKSCKKVHNGEHVEKGENSQASSSAAAGSPSQCKTPPAPRAGSPQTGSESPDSNCSICLSKLENKSFTDSCFHTFCFVCLLEWAKVKAVCPLCKQPFKSIVHNVRSMEDYDRYHLRGSENNESPDGSRFRYRTTLTNDRWMGRQRREQLRQLQMFQRPTQASIRSPWSQLRQNSTSSFRHHIYSAGLWIQDTPQRPGRTLRIRDISSAFFARNPATTHRLIPWLNREMNVLLADQHEDRVQFVVELILDLVQRFDILSEEFAEHIRPFTSTHTEHFIHEFYHFARSPCDMTASDQHAVYGDNTVHTIESSSSSSNNGNDSDVILLSPDPELQQPVHNRDHAYFSNAYFTNSEIHNPEPPAERRDPAVVANDLTPLLDRVRDFLFFDAVDTANTGWDSPLPGPSQHWFSRRPTQTLTQQTTNFENTIDISQKTESDSPSSSSDSSPDSPSSSSKSDESAVLIVGYEKPWESRTPIELSSADEEDDMNVDQAKRQASKKHKLRHSDKYGRSWAGSGDRHKARSWSRDRHRVSRSRSRERKRHERSRHEHDRIKSREHSRSKHLYNRSRSRDRLHSYGRVNYRRSSAMSTKSYKRNYYSRSRSRTRSRSPIYLDRSDRSSQSHFDKRYEKQRSSSVYSSDSRHRRSDNGSLYSSSSRHRQSRSHNGSRSRSKSRSSRSKSESPNKNKKISHKKRRYRSSSIEIIGEKYGKFMEHSKHKKRKKYKKKKSRRNKKERYTHIVSDTSDIEIVNVVLGEKIALDDEKESGTDKQSWKKHPTGHKKSSKGAKTQSEPQPGSSKWKPFPNSDQVEESGLNQMSEPSSSSSNGNTHNQMNRTTNIEVVNEVCEENHIEAGPSSDFGISNQNVCPLLENNVPVNTTSSVQQHMSDAPVYTLPRCRTPDDTVSILGSDEVTSSRTLKDMTQSFTSDHVKEDSGQREGDLEVHHTNHGTGHKGQIPDSTVTDKTSGIGCEGSNEARQKKSEVKHTTLNNAKRGSLEEISSLDSEKISTVSKVSPAEVDKSCFEDSDQEGDRSWFESKIEKSNENYSSLYMDLFSTTDNADTEGEILHTYTDNLNTTADLSDSEDELTKVITNKFDIRTSKSDSEGGMSTTNSDRTTDKSDTEGELSNAEADRFNTTTVTEGEIGSKTIDHFNISTSKSDENWELPGTNADIYNYRTAKSDTEGEMSSANSYGLDTTTDKSDAELDISNEDIDKFNTTTDMSDTEGEMSSVNAEKCNNRTGKSGTEEEMSSTDACNSNATTDKSDTEEEILNPDALNHTGGTSIAEEKIVPIERSKADMNDTSNMSFVNNTEAKVQNSKEPNINPSTSQNFSVDEVLEAVFGPEGLVNQRSCKPRVEESKSPVIGSDVFLPCAPSDSENEAHDLSRSVPVDLEELECIMRDSIVSRINQGHLFDGNTIEND